MESMGLDTSSEVMRQSVSSAASHTVSTPVEETLPAEIDKQLAAVADPNNTMVSTVYEFVSYNKCYHLSLPLLNHNLFLILEGNC